MEEKEKSKSKKSKNDNDNNKKKKPKHQHPNDQTATKTTALDLSFKPSSEVKGLRFGGQLVVRSFTIRRASPPEVQRLLSVPAAAKHPRLASTAAFLPTNFTVLAQRAWHTLTLGLGTTKSKVVLFVFESEPARAQADRAWPTQLALGDANRRLLRGLKGTEMARFKFRKGCLTFYVYAVRSEGSFGFSQADDLRTVLQSVVDLKDFLDHTAMLALPSQRSISFSPVPAMAH